LLDSHGTVQFSPCSRKRPSCDSSFYDFIHIYFQQEALLALADYLLLGSILTEPSEIVDRFLGAVSRCLSYDEEGIEWSSTMASSHTSIGLLLTPIFYDDPDGTTKLGILMNLGLAAKRDALREMWSIHHSRTGRCHIKPCPNLLPLNSFWQSEMRNEDWITFLSDKRVKVWRLPYGECGCETELCKMHWD
jgi:hypothetical protein